MFNFRDRVESTGVPTLLARNGAGLPNRPEHPSACVVRLVRSTISKGVHGVQNADDEHAIQDTNVAAQGEMLDADGGTSTLEIQC